MRYLFILLFTLLSAVHSSEKKLTAQQIIDKTITASGADKIANSQIRFKFRDKNYAAVRRNGNFKLFRTYKNKFSEIEEDLVSNNGYSKFLNGHKLPELENSKAKSNENAVNSVHYFSVLPYGLNDEAVRKKLLPSATIKGKEYYKIEVTFSENGGGEDFEDVFIYWIGKKDFLIDYLAYAYHTNGGGKRFRVLKEQCSINGIRFVDYHNYKPENTSIALIDTDKAFENNQLKKISEIVLEDIEVKILE
ncbi:hypothetical protein SAMN05216503_1776 [Polaribacter sp. KT25b]|uniref:DUF6503 family protein n=1 Tax=Polaribacter sp. KT25b TaxID=1855336 RepID=UPI00087D877E|nr:DUF6503 family protein [Polaribacter sp. KT25b]SDS03819.1 hypothetical protein SAMN05216503_1776 [Polaribacter sp. KT25b]